MIRSQSASSARALAMRCAFTLLAFVGLISNAVGQQHLVQRREQRVYECQPDAVVNVTQSGTVVVTQFAMPSGGTVCTYVVGGGPNTRASIQFTSVDGDPGLTWIGARHLPFSISPYPPRPWLTCLSSVPLWGEAAIAEHI